MLQISSHVQSNNILLDVFKVCKLQKRAEQFMELFNVFELKILGYYLDFSALPENFFFLLSYNDTCPALFWRLPKPAKRSCFALSSNTSLDELNSRSRTMDRVQFFKCLSSSNHSKFCSKRRHF